MYIVMLPLYTSFVCVCWGEGGQVLFLNVYFCMFLFWKALWVAIFLYEKCYINKV